MAVYLAAGAAALIYLLAIPVRAGLAWKTGTQARLGVTVGPFRFSAHGGFSRTADAGLTAVIIHDRSGKIRELSLTGQTVSLSAASARLSALSGAFRYLMNRLKPWRLSAAIHISLNDAAATALLYGVLDSSLRTLRAVRPDFPLTSSITADFRSGRTQCDLCGILSCRLGHIMAAGLIALRDYLSGRIHTWITNSRSKAS